MVWVKNEWNKWSGKRCLCTNREEKNNNIKTVTLCTKTLDQIKKYSKRIERIFKAGKNPRQDFVEEIIIIII